jgi:arabinogalactan oligomer/maltooligosaccharide transport system substrate-binding protein
MKKHYLVLSVFLIFGLLFTGACGGGGSGSGGENIVLRVAESLGGPDEFIREAGRRFTEVHPHITIEFVNIEVGGAVGVIELDGPAGVGPDVFTAPHDHLGALVAGGHILPVANAARVRNGVFDSAVIAATSGGVLYGYPISMETYALFYNKNLIDEADVPLTFDALIAKAQDFDKADYLFLMDIGPYYSIIFTTADGNRLFGPNGDDRVNSNINSAASARGMTFMRQLRTIMDLDAGDLNTSFVDAAFTSGTSAMTITGPWNIAPFEAAGMNFGVTTIPSLPGQNTPPASFAGVRTTFVSAYTEHPAEAHMFAEFLIAPDIQRLRYEITGAIPPASIPTESVHFAGFFRQLEHAFPMPSIPEMGSYWSAMEAAAANIWNGMNVQEQLNMAHQAMVGN